MKFAISHSVYVHGGGEVVAFNMYGVLKRAGHVVKVFTASRVKAEEIADFTGVPVDPEDVVVVKPPLKTEILGRVSGGRFARLRWAIAAGKIFEEVDSYDVVIDTRSNTPYFSDVAYIHYPLTSPGGGGLYEWLIKRYLRAARRSRLVLANSAWTAEKVRRAFDVEPLVLHPPVDYEYFYDNSADRDKTIVTLTRLDTDKRVHELARVVRAMPSWGFVLCGRGSERTPALLSMMGRAMGDPLFYNRIAATIRSSLPKGASFEKAISSYGRAFTYTHNNATIVINPSRAAIRKMLGSAKYYLHPPFPEHFGIAVAEAMSAGLVPIVYCDGGAYTDLASKVSPNLCYRDVYDVPKIIGKIEESGEWESLSARAREVASAFSKKRFEERFLEILGGAGIL